VKKYNKRGINATLKDISSLESGKLLLMGTISTNNGQFLLQVSPDGELEVNYMFEMLSPKGANIPIGERGMKRSDAGSDGAAPREPTMDEADDALYYVMRYQTPSMSQGTRSSSTETTRTVLRIDEVFTYAKAYKIMPES